MTGRAGRGPGARLRSQVCSTEVVVARAAAGAVALSCGGHPMVPVGKRCTSEVDDTFEVLVTKAGVGALGDGVSALVQRPARSLPASD